jgi:NAD(P)-dependent dehydrogenase (short-subunit alcohol dehydrogenase family)
MRAVDAAAMLRPGLLDGVGVLVAPPATPQPGPEPFGEAVAAACSALGAAVSGWGVPTGASHEPLEAASDEAVTRALGELERIDVLVIDAAALFAAEPDGAAEARAPDAGSALGACLQAAWTLTRSVFNLALLPAERGGRLLYLAPRDGAGAHSPGALAGLENLSRTLSIEWSRHGVTAVTIAPGPLTPAGEVAALAAYLASPAGAYFSGCLLDLRGAGGPRS